MLTVINGDCLTGLREQPGNSVQCCITSPPYFGLRDYGHIGQIGQEATPAAYVAKMVEVFDEVRRVLKPGGTLWLNLGDSYAGSWGEQSREHAGKHAPNLSALSANQVKAAQIRASGTGSLGRTPGLKAKDLIGVPWRVAFALQEAGWWLRSDIIWAKPNCMPESVTDRPTRSHEYLFLLTKSATYYYDAEAIKEPGVCYDDRSVDGFVPKSQNGKHHNGRQTATARVSDKQRVHSRRHQGFNDRWDNAEKEAQCSGMRNKRDVWTVAPANYSDAHFATFPPELIKPCVLAGSKSGDVIMDPFGGSGTTGMVAIELGRRALLMELNPDYCAMIKQRCAITPGLPL